MVALEWGDIDLVKRQTCVKRSSWKAKSRHPKPDGFLRGHREMVSLCHCEQTPGIVSRYHACGREVRWMQASRPPRAISSSSAGQWRTFPQGISD